MRANDLKELFVYDARTDVTTFTIGSGASESNAKGDCHKVIVTVGFSFARIRDTSCRS
jgi:hypothetical protein